MALACFKCKEPHNLDLAPDTGVCYYCLGPLVEDGETPAEPDLSMLEAPNKTQKQHD